MAPQSCDDADDDVHVEGTGQTSVRSLSTSPTSDIGHRWEFHSILPDVPEKDLPVEGPQMMPTAMGTVAGAGDSDANICGSTRTVTFQSPINYNMSARNDRPKDSANPKHVCQTEATKPPLPKKPVVSKYRIVKEKRDQNADFLPEKFRLVDHAGETVEVSAATNPTKDDVIRTLVRGESAVVAGEDPEPIAVPVVESGSCESYKTPLISPVPSSSPSILSEDEYGDDDVDRFPAAGAPTSTQFSTQTKNGRVESDATIDELRNTNAKLHRELKIHKGNARKIAGTLSLTA